MLALSKISMQYSLRLSLSLSGAAALALANTPLLSAAAQETGSAEDFGGMDQPAFAALPFPSGFCMALSPKASGSPAVSMTQSSGMPLNLAITTSAAAWP